jgi:hypothetical protein
MHTGMIFFTRGRQVEVTKEEVIGTGALEGQDSPYTLMQNRKS